MYVPHLIKTSLYIFSMSGPTGTFPHSLEKACLTCLNTSIVTVLALEQVFHAKTLKYQEAIVKLPQRWCQVHFHKPTTDSLLMGLNSWVHSFTYHTMWPDHVCIKCLKINVCIWAQVEQQLNVDGFFCLSLEASVEPQDNCYHHHWRKWQIKATVWCK